MVSQTWDAHDRSNRYVARDFGQNSVSYTHLTPQQLVNLDKSTAYLRIGYIGFEHAWMDKPVSYTHLDVYKRQE